MKFKKLAILLAAVACVASLALVGCGGSSDEAAPAEGDQAAATTDLGLLNEGKLTVATSPDFPPFENIVDGEYVGLDMEIAKAVAAELGLEFNPVVIQFDGIIPALQSGGQADIAISGMTITPERQDQVDFSTAYYVDDLAIVVVSGGDLTADNIDEALNAEGMTIAVQSGTTGESYATENFASATTQPYGNATDTFAALQSDQANAVITNKAVAEAMLASYEDCEIVKSIATNEEYGIAVPKGNEALLNAVNDAIAKLQADGTIDKLTTEIMGSEIADVTEEAEQAIADAEANAAK
ncbi:MAG: ABC transporter substrate-binding protein [Coriobacteriales bacterium]|jgi:polar amino acid transport system substrate-binding protein